MRLNRVLLGIFAGLMVVSGGVQAQSAEQRLQRLERFLDNSALIDMLQQVDSLQNEVRQLRGALEERDNTINAMRERQRKLYLDTDNRIAALENGGGGGSLSDLEGLEGLDDLEGLDGLEDFDENSDIKFMERYFSSSFEK